MKIPYRAYDLVRTMVEEHGGTMVYEQEGHSVGGAWVISVAGKRTNFPYDNRSFPGIDELHVPKPGITPKYFDDYLHQLLPDAWERLLKNMKYRVYPITGIHPDDPDAWMDTLAD